MNRKRLTGIILVIAMLVIGCVMQTPPVKQSFPEPEVILGEPILCWSTQVVEPPNKPGAPDITVVTDGVIPSHAKAIMVWFLDARIPKDTQVTVVWVLDGQPVGQQMGVANVNFRNMWLQIHNYAKPISPGEWIFLVQAGNQQRRIDFKVLALEETI